MPIVLIVIGLILGRHQLPTSAKAWAQLVGSSAPRFGVAHSLALSLGPWLAAELPDLVARGVVSDLKK